MRPGLLVTIGQVCLIAALNVCADAQDGAGSAAVAPPGITIPSGTEIAVRTIDRIESKRAEINREYKGSLDDPVIVDGVTVIPRTPAPYCA